MTKSKGSRRDIYQEVTDRIVTALEEGTVPWRRPWASVGRPVSMSTGRAYRGVNAMLLPLAAMDAGYSSPWWGTYKQIQALGGQVRKGERGTLVTFWKRLSFVDRDETGEEVSRTVPMLRHFTVFNAEQADGLPLPYYAAGERGGDFEPIEAAEAAVSRYLEDGPEYREGGDAAYYEPRVDRVTLPPREGFDSAEDRYSVLFHELTHSTGHPSRLNREGVAEPHAFGDPVYSREELIAEIGAAMLCASTGIETTLPNSAAYVAGWLRAIRDDPRAVVVAAGRAQRAADLVLGESFEAEGTAEPERIAA